MNPRRLPGKRAVTEGSRPGPIHQTKKKGLVQRASKSTKQSMEFKKCRLLFQNVWNRKLTPVQSRILRRLKGRNRALLRNISARRNLNSYIQLQTTRKLALFHANRFVHNRKDATIPFLLHLETRLDVILVRAHFCETLPQARQLISHRKVSVNNRIVQQSHFRVSTGDHLNLKETLLSRKRRIQRLLTVQLKKKVSQLSHGRRFRDRRKQRELLSKLLYMQKF